MTVTIHKTRPEWARPLGTIVFVPFKIYKKTGKVASQDADLGDKPNKAANVDGKKSTVISEDSHHE